MHLLSNLESLSDRMLRCMEINPDTQHKDSPDEKDSTDADDNEDATTVTSFNNVQYKEELEEVLRQSLYVDGAVEVSDDPQHTEPSEL